MRRGSAGLRRKVSFVGSCQGALGSERLGCVLLGREMVCRIGCSEWTPVSWHWRHWFSWMRLEMAVPAAKDIDFRIFGLELLQQTMVLL